MAKKSWLVLVLIAVMLLSGCSSDEDIAFDRPTTSLVIIAGKHANANNFYDDIVKKAEEIIEGAVDYYKEGGEYVAKLDLAVIVCDGSPRPEELLIGGQQTLITGASDKRKYLERVDGMLSAVTQALVGDEVRAQEQGVDLQGALNQARKYLQSSDAENKHILIMDTGISTEGHLDMRVIQPTEGSLEEVMSRIDPNTFPNLEGITVTFLGLGNVAAPQEGSGNNLEVEKRLEDFWTAYLVEKCHATLNGAIIYAPSRGDALSYSEDAENPYPYVPAVKLIKEKPVENEITPDNHIIEEAIIPYAEVGFLPDSDRFRDENQAMKAIAARADALNDYFRQNPGKVVYIVGSIARVYRDEAVMNDSQISLIRAQRIHDILVSQFGFDASQFVVVDAGSQRFTWREHDEEYEKELNRLVALIAETDTQRVQELRNAGEIK